MCSASVRVRQREIDLGDRLSSKCVLDIRLLNVQCIVCIQLEKARGVFDKLRHMLPPSLNCMPFLPKRLPQGNNLYLSLGNITANPKAGLLFINRQTGNLHNVIPRRLCFSGATLAIRTLTCQVAFVPGCICSRVDGCVHCRVDVVTQPICLPLPYYLVGGN